MVRHSKVEGALSTVPYKWRFNYTGFYGVWFMYWHRLHAYKHTYLNPVVNYGDNKLPDGGYVAIISHYIKCGLRVDTTRAIPKRGLQYVLLRKNNKVVWKRGERKGFPYYCPICYAQKEAEWKANGMYDKLLAYEIKKFKREFKRDPFTGRPEV